MCRKDDDDNNNNNNGNQNHGQHPDRVEFVQLKDDASSCAGGASLSSSGLSTTNGSDLASLPRLTRGYFDGKNNNNTNNGPAAAGNNKDWMGRQAKQAIWTTKIVLIVVLLGAVVGMSVGAFKYVQNQEESTFRGEFHSLAREAIALSSRNIRNKFETADLLGTSLSAMVAASNNMNQNNNNNSGSNTSWPMVTIPNYGPLAERARTMSQADIVVLAPVVEDYQRLEYEAYLRANIHDNIQEMLDYRGLSDVRATDLEGVPDVISALNITTGAKIPETRPGPYLINWNFYPFNPKRFFTGNNLLALQTNRNAYASVVATRAPSLSFANLISGIRGQIFQPIFEHVDHGRIVAVLWMTSFWERYFTDIVPSDVVGHLDMVLSSSCGFVATFAVNATTVVLRGAEDLHDPRYNHLVESGELFSIANNRAVEDIPADACLDTLTVQVYPRDDFRAAYHTRAPFLYAGIVVVIFAVCLALFLGYDWAVNQRQIKILWRLQKQDQIVADIFPQQIMTRLYGDENDMEELPSLDNTEGSLSLTGGSRKHHRPRDPIADLYLESTIFHSNIHGFTAWSSQREPTQVFMLLEHLYAEFDRQARRYGVFKVESIGDCYIAATGVPDHDPCHCVTMAKFARKCTTRSASLMRLLETKLGPDTGDLEVRIGLHSGQVTAGVLRGDRARFQLFGDTVNTAEQLLRHSRGQMIHISNVTAQLLQEAGKAHWVVKRTSSSTGHSPGMMKNTYWLKTTKSKSRARPTNHEPPSGSSEHTADDNESLSDHDDDELNDGMSPGFDLLGGFEQANQLTKTQRLVEWNVDVLTGLLEQVIAGRKVAAPMSRNKPSLFTAEMSIGNNKTVLDEFAEIIILPNQKSSSDVLERQRVSKQTVLPSEVKDKIRHLVASVASMYRDNPFHNFEHASHVTASVVKMLKRITDTDVAAQKRQLSQIQSLHNSMDALSMDAAPSGDELDDMAMHSYGITSDPLTQFAVVFCSIIHDADHPGVTNAVLVKEDTYLSRRYKQKSVAEQNSVDLVWSLFMSPEYTTLRECIYTTEEELRRFRQIIVNIVMATDICDKELGALRKNRWNVAFAEDAVRASRALKNDMDRKATIVLEHLIQASDVSHTMQHWNVYLLWNERLFREMHRAYKEGRMDSDPTQGWYKGEIGFFDFYIIPLAKKLESCGVFGVSSAEYLEYALKNRDQWEQEGEAIVAEYLTRLNHSDETQRRSGKTEFVVEDLEVGL